MYKQLFLNQQEGNLGHISVGWAYLQSFSPLQVGHLLHRIFEGSFFGYSGFSSSIFKASSTSLFSSLLLGSFFELLFLYLFF